MYVLLYDIILLPEEYGTQMRLILFKIFLQHLTTFRFFSNTSPPFHHTPQNTFFLWQLICG